MGLQYGKVLKEVIFDTDRGVTVTFEGGTAAADRCRWSGWRKIPHEEDPTRRGGLSHLTNAVPHDQPSDKVYGRASSLCAQPAPNTGLLNSS